MSVFAQGHLHIVKSGPVKKLRPRGPLTNVTACLTGQKVVIWVIWAFPAFISPTTVIVKVSNGNLCNVLSTIFLEIQFQLLVIGMNVMILQARHQRDSTGSFKPN